MMQQVYCRDLEAVGEGPLHGDRSYRLLYSPGFDRVVVAAIEWTGDKAVARGRVLTDRGMRTPGHLRTTSATATKDQWRFLMQRLENAGYGQVPQPPAYDDSGFWFLEGREQGKYHFFEFGSVDETTSPQVDKAFHYLAELAGLRPEELAPRHYGR